MSPFLIASLVVWCASGQRAAAAERRQEALENCPDNLLTVYRALHDYRRVHKSLPGRLAELVPEFLNEDKGLMCPSSPRAAQSPACPYVYEFEALALTNALARELGVTRRGWRELQMGRLGSEVPLLRCTNHVPVLNVSFGGRSFESDLEWEGHFAALVRQEDLGLEKLLSEHFQLISMRIPAREPDLPREWIDLSAHYNGSLQGWLEWNPEANLAQLPAGRVRLAGVGYDARGVVQLCSEQFNMLHRPPAVSNILIGVRASSLVFLHGTIAEEAASTVIGRYVLHLEDGSNETLDLAYGRQVVHWRANPPAGRQHKDTERCWSGTHQDEKGATRAVHLYGTRWVHPRPHLLIRSLDFVSTLKQSSPFLVAVTAEPPAAAPVGAREATQNDPTKETGK